MRELFDPDLDVLVDEEDIAEFRQGLEAIGDDHRRILMILIPRLVALEERGDSTAALALIAEIKRIVTGGEAPRH
jgi:hypothetical protein